ncbi:integrase [Psychromonas sp. MB-3u-54]|uniref:tyrosine-type recombinase/integrase n=1 Tax=Psychromonas sp. MB-3u-54 TaxID=2058319 RepID=UPI000C32CDAA|nr:integrase arm-type DNA-binding domain-containing protein [Psychromonas sp. MB-3u-54]PKH04577.1 integrase [Psychromonas sp. MB-3u-54]
MAKTTPLTDTQIKKAKPQEKEYHLYDGNGLALRVKPTGSKLWLFNYYRPISRKRSNLSLGKYPDLSLAKARAKTVAARELLADGIDPKEHRDGGLKAKQAILKHSFEMVANDWLKLKASEVKEGTYKTISNTLINHIFPAIGKQPITAITAPQVITALRPIEAKGNLEVIARVCQYLNQIMRYAVNHGIIHSNSLAGIKEVFMANKATNNPHIKPEQLPELLNAITTANIKKVTRWLILWQMHTMTRPAETALAQWSEIDLDNNLWTIRAERMKTGVEHKIPLTEQTLAILDAIKPLSGNSPYIFPADRDPNSHANKASANMALKRLGYQGKQTAHGLRGLARTMLSDQGFSYEASEACLSHKVGNSVSQSYNHSTYLNQRIKIMQWWSTHIEEATYGRFNMTNTKILKVV